MASFHSRSNSLPSKSHPLMDEAENLICRIKSSTTSSNSLCSNLGCLRDLHQGINSIIQLPWVQQALSRDENWLNELVEGSLALVDLCGFSRDMIYSANESIRELESSIRRNRGETATDNGISAYLASRKKIVKKVKKNLKSFNQNSTALPHKDSDESDLKAVATMLNEARALDLYVLKSVLLLLSGEKEDSKQRSWPFLSKFSNSKTTRYEEEMCFFSILKSSRKGTNNVEMLQQLKSTEMTFLEIEEGLEALFKSFVRTRVSLLNLLSH